MPIKKVFKRNLNLINPIKLAEIAIIITSRLLAERANRREPDRIKTLALISFDNK